MAVYRYPQEIHDFVKKWSPKLRDNDLAEACNREFGTSFTAKSMKAFRGNHGYRNGKKQWTKEEYWKYQKRYPQGMYEFVRDNSWGVSSKEMAEMVNEKFGTNFTQNMMKQFRQRHGIKSGVTGWYQKGHPPGNKGMKQSDYMSPEAIEKSKATRFQKGNRPANELPVGSIVTNVYGYKLRKKQMEGTLWERWESLHRAVWEEHNGPVPEGKMVSFLDGDKGNCDIGNLVLIDNSVNMEMNRSRLRSSDAEITRTGVAIASLKVGIRQKKRGKT